MAIMQIKNTLKEKESFYNRFVRGRVGGSNIANVLIHPTAPIQSNDTLFYCLGIF